MELTPKQQTVDLIKKSNNILIMTGEKNKGDGIASALALSSILKKVGKKTAVVKDNIKTNYVSFLPESDGITEDFGGNGDFTISLSLKKTQASRVKYEVEGDQLKFYVTPKDGKFDSNDVSFASNEGNWDLVIVLDSPDLEHLGKLYEENTEFFYNKPIINIDHNPANEYFGIVNFIDLTASSTAEIMVSLIDSIGQGLVDEDVATCLLAGILIDTNSFQNSHTTPKSLTTTAQLIAAGARHEEVVKFLFKTKSFDVLKIWGHILSSVETDKDYKLLWSYICLTDIGSREMDKETITGVMDELLLTVPNINVYILFMERHEGLKGYIRTKSGIEAGKIAYLFGGAGRGEDAEFYYKNTDIEKAKDEIIQRVKEYIRQARLVS